MSRSVTDTLAIVGRLDKAGAGFVSLTESIDTTSVAGRMMVTMLAAFAAFERELTAERTATALHHKRANGERTGGVPFGWDVDADGRLVAVEAEQAVLAEIRAARAAASPPLDVALREAIQASGLTHYAIGQAAGVSPGQTDRFVSGERDLRLGTAARIGEALGLVLVPRR